MQARYQAPLTLEASLRKIKADYLEITKTDFESTSTKVGQFFGYKDVKTRERQMSIIEAIAQCENPTNASNPRDAFAEKFQLMVAIGYIISTRIYDGNKVCPVGSDLYKLLTKALNIESDNQLDPYTINECLYTLLRTDKSQINLVLRVNKQEELSETEWQIFKESAIANKVKVTAAEDSSLVAHSFGTVSAFLLRSVGWGVGFAFGLTLGRTGVFATAKTALRSVISTIFITLGPVVGGGAAAASLLAYPHAERAVDTAVGYGSAQLFGKGAEMVGYNLGWLVGKGVDMSVDAACELGSMAYEKVTGPHVEVDIAIGLDLVAKTLSARSTKLSQEAFLEQITNIVEEHLEADAQKQKGETDIIQPTVMTFAISPEERALLPEALKLLGHEKEAEELAISPDAATAAEDEEEAAKTSPTF